METNKLKEQLNKLLIDFSFTEIPIMANNIYTLFSDVCAKLLDWYETTPLYTIKELNEDSSWSDIANYFITNIYKQ